MSSSGSTAPPAMSRRAGSSPACSARTIEQYNATTAVTHHPWPNGQLYHAAGPTDGGVLIAAVWETKDDFGRFLRDRVMPGMPINGGLTGQPEQRTAEIATLAEARD
jgi:hypothetical protein